MDEKLLKLRAVELSDIDLIYKWENDISLWNVGGNRGFYSRYAIEEFVKNTQNLDVFASCQVRNMVDVFEDGIKTIGCVDLYEIDPQHNRAGVGIFIEKEFRNKHYAQQTLMKMEQYAKTILNLHQVYAYVACDNVASIALFESQNYFSSAVLKQWIRKKEGYFDVKIYQKIL